MTRTRVTLLGAGAWAAAVIFSASVFRGQQLGDGIESALIVGFLMFLSVRAVRCSRRRAELTDQP